jgi:hypothetical protein
MVLAAMSGAPTGSRGFAVVEGDEAASALSAGAPPAPLVAGVPAVRLSTRCPADTFGLNEPIRSLGIASGGNG